MPSLLLQKVGVVKMKCEHAKNNAALARHLTRCIDAMEAIRARIDGEFDNKRLRRFGPLGNTNEDIRQIIDKTIRGIK